jgi:hypothetical protein
MRLPFTVRDRDVQGNFDALLKEMGRTVKAAFVVTFESTASTSYVALTTAGPSVTVPTGGVYLIEFGAYMRNATAGVSALMSYNVNGSGAADTLAAQVDSGVAANGGSGSAAYQQTLAAGAVVTAVYKASAGTASFGRRWLKVTHISDA